MSLLADDVMLPVASGASGARQQFVHVDLFQAEAGKPLKMPDSLVGRPDAERR